MRIANGIGFDVEVSGETGRYAIVVVAAAAIDIELRSGRRRVRMCIVADDYRRTNVFFGKVELVRFVGASVETHGPPGLQRESGRIIVLAVPSVDLDKLPS